MLFRAPAGAYPNHDNPALIFLSILILASILIYGVCIRLKTVALDGGDLVISNYKKTIRVPLRNVEHISGSLFVSPELVWITFRLPTDFGTKIQFMAKWRMFQGFTRPPIVKELNEMVRHRG
jgi:hypothetical protein